jgi:autotransporter family porin
LAGQAGLGGAAGLGGTAGIDGLAATTAGDGSAGIRSESGTLMVINQLEGLIEGGAGGVAQISGAGGAGVHITGTSGGDSTIMNFGTIRGGNAGSQTANAGAGIKLESGVQVLHIHNMGAILGGSVGLNSVGIHNAAGQLTRLTNRQAGLTYKGTAPANYDIVITGTAAGEYGTLIVKDTPNWGIGAMTFGVAEGSTPSSGVTYQDVIKAEGNSTFDSTDSKTSQYVTSGGTYAMSLVWDGANWDLSAQRMSFFKASALALSNTVASPAAVVLDAQLALGSKFQLLNTEQEYSDAAAQTLPLLVGGSISAATATLNDLGRVVQTRNASTRGLASGNGYVSDGNLWFRPFGSWVNQADRGGVSGYKSRASGMAFGIDGAYSSSTRLGLAFTYADVNTDGNSLVAPNRADISLNQLVGYGTSSLGNNIEFDYQMGVGQNKTEGKRSIVLAGLTAASAYAAQVSTAGMGLTRMYSVNEFTAFMPSVRADYTHIRDAGYTETGAEELNLIVKRRAAEQFLLAFDAKMEHSLSPGVKLSVNAGVAYDTLAKQSAITAAFAGAPGASFTTTGVKPDPWGHRFGFGLSSKVDNGPDFSVRLDAEHRKGFTNQTASVKVRWDY